MYQETPKKYGDLNFFLRGFWPLLSGSESQCVGGVYHVVCFAEVPHDTVLVGPPGHGGLDEGDQGVRSLGETVVEGQPGVVVVQAAVGHNTELGSGGAGLEDPMVRDVVHRARPALQLVLGEVTKDASVEEVLQLQVVGVQLMLELEASLQLGGYGDRLPTVVLE